MSMGPLKVTFKRPSMEAESDFGSLSELVGALQDQGAALIKLFGSDMEMLVQGLASGTALATGVIGSGGPGETNAAPTETAAQRKKREKEEAKAASEARRTETTPPAAPAPAPVDMTPNANGIPAGLARDPVTNTAPAVQATPPAPPTPPVAPPAPPAPPVPPSGVLAAKIIPYMEGIAATSPDGGKAWVDWLATSGIVVAGATFEEAMKVIRMQSDEKLAPIAAQLPLAA